MTLFLLVLSVPTVVAFVTASESTTASTPLEPMTPSVIVQTDASDGRCAIRNRQCATIGAVEPSTKPVLYRERSHAEPAAVVQASIASPRDGMPLAVPLAMTLAVPPFVSATNHASKPPVKSSRSVDVGCHTAAPVAALTQIQYPAPAQAQPEPGR